MNDKITESTSINIVFPPKEELPVDEDGQLLAPRGIRILKNGAGFNTDTKRMVYGPGTFFADSNAFTTETAKEAHLVKIEKAETMLAEKIEKAMGMPADVAWAEGGAILFKEIVMGKTSAKLGGRERVDAWEKIGQKLGLVVDKDKLVAMGKAGSANIGDLNIPIEFIREARMILELRAKMEEQYTTSRPEKEEEKKQPAEHNTKEGDFSDSTQRQEN